MIRLGRLLILIGVSGLPLAAQQQQAPAFEVASVKPRTGDLPLTVGPIAPDRFYRSDITLNALVQFAYELRDFQVEGGPEWVRSDRWSVDARADGPQRPAAMRLLVRRLLAERFGLQTHTEQRELPTYELLLARRDGTLGQNIKRATVDCRPFLTGERPREESPREDASGFARCSTGGRSGGGAFTPRFNGQPISALARLLEPMVRRRVIDKTGLQGIFDVELTVALEVAGLPPPPPGARVTEAPSVFVALQEQLGLKLESARGPVEVLVIDSVERPTPN
jgi:uncharacterized protein (TIGR03435 family)